MNAVGWLALCEAGSGKLVMVVVVAVWMIVVCPSRSMDDVVVDKMESG